MYIILVTMSMIVYSEIRIDNTNGLGESDENEFEEISI